MEIEDRNVVLQLSNVLAMTSVESQIAVLFSDADCVSLALYAVSDDTLTLSEPRVHKVYSCKESQLSSVVTASLITSVMPASFHEKCASQCCYSSNILHISDELFNVLFGIDLNLSRCTIMLLQGHSGLVLWLPIKEVTGSRPSSVQVLCSLRDSLVHILTFSSCSDDGASPRSSYLVLIGYHGHVLVISLDAGGTMPSYQHYDILGPVRCCISFDNSYMLYSTGNDLYLANVGQSVKGNQPGSVKSTALGISGVAALSAVHSSDYNRTAHCKLPVFCHNSNICVRLIEFVNA